MKEPYSGPDVHFASGSFGKLPHLVACHESIRAGGKGKPGKEKERGGREQVVQPFSKLGWRHQI